MTNQNTQLDDQNTQRSDQINLSELIAALWSHKVFITLITGLSIFFAGFYTLNTKKTYTAKVVFEINKGQSSGISLDGELGVLASIAGFGSSFGSGTDLLLERILSREFILQVSKSLSLSKDAYFNDFNPNATDPIWKAVIKNAIGWHSNELGKDAIIRERIIRNYREAVSGSPTSAGAVEIFVQHNDPILASKYANSIMEEVRLLVEQEDEKAKKFRLSYLAETLADALQEMENAQNKLKEYALENSTAARENFITGSIKLDTLRMEKRDAEEYLIVLRRLSSLVKTEGLDTNAYEALKTNSPLVDDVNFRRILGMSETISAWTWPSVETINEVSYTLSDRVKRLSVEIADIEQNAKLYASSAEDLAKFTRDAKIAEATFTVLTEQVKSQSLAVGYKPESFKVFSYAYPPLVPTSPKRTLILVIGAVLGLFFGSTLSLINAMRRGVYYTRSSLVSDVGAAISLNSKKFRSIKNLHRGSVVSSSSYIQSHAELDQANIALTQKNVVLFICSSGQPTASKTARLIATKSAQSGRNVVVCDAADYSNGETSGKPEQDVSGLIVSQSDDGFDILKDCHGSSFFTSVGFNKNLETLMSSYDQVFVTSDQKQSIASLLAMKTFEPSLVLISNLRNSTKGTIQKITSLHPVSILFHD